MKKIASSALIAALFAASAPATLYETNDTQRANLARCDAAFKQNVSAFGNSTNHIVARGLFADKAKNEIRIMAEACNIVSGTTVEFPIIGELSDRDYEGLFRTFAKPGDIARALEWLGMPRGANVDSQKCVFWPTGERVAVTIIKSPSKEGEAPSAEIPVQQFIMDTSTKKSPAWDSFVYCGSPDDPVLKDGTRLADTTAPNSVLATYNDSQTILDLPELSSQSAVYERYILNKDAPFVPFQPYEIVLRPVKTADGLPRVRKIALKMESDAEGKITFCADQGKKFTDAAAVFENFREIAKSHDLFVTLYFDDSLTVAQAKGLATAMISIEGPNGIRIAPPPPGAFYCRGFIPAEDLRLAKTRITQPWEVHFTTNGAPATLVKTIEDWSNPNSLDPSLTRKEFKASTPAEAVKIVSDNGDGLPGIIVYAPASAKLSTFMPFVRALNEKHPTVYVFDEN